MNLNELKSIITRSFPDYLLTSETMFVKDKEKSVLSAFSFFISLFFLFFLVYAIVNLIILNAGVGVPVAKQIKAFTGLITFNLGYFLVQLLVIIIALHLLALLFKKRANFSDSLKITFISSAYWMAMINLIASLNVLLQSFMQAFALSQSMRTPGLIVSGIMFVWVAANGIRVLHGLSGMKSYCVATCTILLAFLAGYFYGELLFSQFFLVGSR